MSTETASRMVRVTFRSEMIHGCGQRDFDAERWDVGDGWVAVLGPDGVIAEYPASEVAGIAYVEPKPPRDVRVAQAFRQALTDHEAVFDGLAAHDEAQS